MAQSLIPTITTKALTADSPVTPFTTALGFCCQECANKVTAGQIIGNDQNNFYLTDGEDFPVRFMGETLCDLCGAECGGELVWGWAVYSL